MEFTTKLYFLINCRNFSVGCYLSRENKQKIVNALFVGERSTCSTLFEFRNEVIAVSPTKRNKIAVFFCMLLYVPILDFYWSGNLILIDILNIHRNCYCEETDTTKRIWHLKIQLNFATRYIRKLKIGRFIEHECLHQLNRGTLLITIV